MAGKNAEKRVDGRVSGINKYGIQIDGGQEWLDWSKFLKDRPEVQKGDGVELLLQEKDRGDGWWIMRCKVEGQPDNGSRPSSRDNGERDFEQTMDRQGQPGRKPEHTDRDALIVRQVALKAAVEFHAGTDPARVSLDDVFTVAEAMYRWMLGS